MLPDDPRHGTTAGHQAHRKDGEDACEPCVAAKTRYEKTRHVYGDRMVPAIGTRRRIQALMAMGHSGADIARVMGITYQAVHKIEVGSAPRIFRATAEKVDSAYARLCMTIPNGYQRTRVRNKAARLGYVPPLAWDDIDDPDEQPKHNIRSAGNLTEWQRGIDMSVVWRLVDEGKRVRNLTAAEGAEACRILLGRGLSGQQIQQRYGLNVERMQRGAA